MDHDAHSTNDLDLAILGQTVGADTSAWTLCRIQATLLTGSWADAQVVVEASLDGVGWSTITPPLALTGVGLSEPFCVRAVSRVRARVATDQSEAGVVRVTIAGSTPNGA